MPAELKLKLEEITESDLVEIFKRFCKVYDIGYPNGHEKRLITEALNDLRTYSNFQYKLYPKIELGAIFFGKKKDESIQFWDYKKIRGKGWKEKDERFKKSVEEDWEGKYSNNQSQLLITSLLQLLSQLLPAALYNLTI